MSPLDVFAELPTNMNGGNGKVAYIDREATFCPVAIVPIADAGAAALDNKHALLLGLASIAEEPFCLMIVDSEIAQFRVDFTGRGELADRQQKFAQILSMFIKLAEDLNVSVYITNEGSIDTCSIKDAQLAHTLQFPLSMPLTSETAIMAMDINGHLFMGYEALISPGVNPPCDKGVWLNRSVVVGTSGKLKLIDWFRNGIRGYLEPLWGSIQNMIDLASHTRRFLQTNRL